MTVVHMAGSIALGTAAMFTVAVMLVTWILFDNRNSRRLLTTVAMGAPLVVGLVQFYFIAAGDHRINQCYSAGTGPLVEWETPIMFLVSGMFLTLAACIYLAVDTHMSALLTLMAGIMGFAFFASERSCETKGQYYWFLVAFALSITTFILAIWAKKRDKDYMAWFIFIMIAIGLILTDSAWLIGPEVGGVVTNTTEYWMLFVAAAFLFLFIPLFLVFTNGAEDSILNAIKTRFREGRSRIDPNNA